MPKFHIFHKILRAEYIRITIEADDEEDAEVKGLSLCQDLSSANYEPGDVEESADRVGVKPAPDDAELTDLDELE